MTNETVLNVRPRRSALYMPGANVRAMEKARALAADVLILDLEDAVAPDAKGQARAQVAAAVRLGGYGRREVVVRINALATPWGRDDLSMIAPLDVHAVLMPKVESGAQVRELAHLLEDLGAPKALRIWAMIETPLAVVQLNEIATADPRLEVLVMGTSDLVKELHARHTPGRTEVLAALSLSVLVARAHGLSVLDGVHLNLNDPEGFRASCERGRDLGFDGKTLIHPNQITAANEVFGPSATEVAEAHRRVAAFDAARAAGEGIVVVDGKLVEALHVEEAMRVLALAASIRSGA